MWSVLNSPTPKYNILNQTANHSTPLWLNSFPLVKLSLTKISPSLESSLLFCQSVHHLQVLPSSHPPTNQMLRQSPVKARVKITWLYYKYTSHASIAYRKQLPPQQTVGTNGSVWQESTPSKETTRPAQTHKVKRYESEQSEIQTAHARPLLEPIGSSPWLLSQTVVTTGCQ